MNRISIDDAGARIAEALRRAEGPEPVVIVENSEPIALLVRLPKEARASQDWPLLLVYGPLGEKVVVLHENQPATSAPVPEHAPQPVFGSCKGMLTIVQDDDEHLKDFDEYMR